MVKYQIPLRAFLGLIALSTVFRLCDPDVVVFNDSFLQEPFSKRLNDGYEGVPKHAKRDLDMRELGARGRFVDLLFEIRLEKGLECGGAYLKYLPPKLKEFDNSSYSIMFGLDKCGSKNKVHFVLKHKNQTSGEYIEHHLKSPPTVTWDELCHVCTAILKPNNDLVIVIDGKQKKHANFLNKDDFEPQLLIPAKTISDPNSEKPVDGDERAKVSERPEAVNPGDSETPKCKSPIRKSVFNWCERKNPSKVRNPVRRGKCHSPPIDNPNNDMRKAKEFPNPDYNEHKKPHYELETSTTRFP